MKMTTIFKSLKEGDYDGTALQAALAIHHPKFATPTLTGGVVEMRATLSTLSGLFHDYNRVLSANQSREHALSLYKLLCEKGKDGKSFAERINIKFPTVYELNGIQDAMKCLDFFATPAPKEKRHGYKICASPHDFTFVPFSIHQNGLFCLWSWERQIPAQEWLKLPLFVIRGTIITIYDFLRGCRDQHAHLNPKKDADNPMTYMCEDFTVRLAFTLSSAFMVALTGYRIDVKFEENVNDSCLIHSQGAMMSSDYVQKVFERWRDKYHWSNASWLLGILASLEQEHELARQHFIHAARKGASAHSRMRKVFSWNASDVLKWFQKYEAGKDVFFEHTEMPFALTKSSSRFYQGSIILFDGVDFMANPVFGAKLGKVEDGAKVLSADRELYEKWIAETQAKWARLK